MIKPLKYEHYYKSPAYFWAGALIIDGGFLALLILWFLWGYSGAGNLIIFCTIAMALYAVISSCISKKEKPPTLRIKGYRLYGSLSNAFFISILVWHSQVLLAAIFLITIIYEFINEKAPDYIPIDQVPLK